MKYSGLFLAAVAAVFASVPAAVEAKDCEVCIKVIQDIRDSMDKADIKKKPKVEAAMGDYCARSDLGPREKKVCYYIDPIKRDVAQPFSTGMPPDRVCKRINQSNPEICGVKFPIKTEKLEPKDLSKLRVKQLKSILADRGVECKGCIEKEEFIKKVQETEHLEPEL
uniref:Mesencephalic astrocyte-derived neurotrophic factor homolog n=1 Tax=Pseudictyota dubia TaxID=2749911 RepID=A0A7R9VPQ9_9STRA|mmetsp:Transcript_20287/g.38158  ORF Transcript_20287/g.38158 Transcript_20287/m.38158 type:complete len:167 (+) Transcript_20287:193-693(+)|eukprot:CAMPEP_0197440798 /NCGR_PEP_ID=MMETSP1175-20131217/7214_1 /TAXON_ID=1003142 /ORGANISM="Triceratium dubium, Strain CCMP147" /LENGTH=166 /DNA_ID=CAMNT_0042970971 /DNA_START=200 /DNA_END=700 /DNA_ORIENTATION=+